MQSTNEVPTKHQEEPEEPEESCTCEAPPKLVPGAGAGAGAGAAADDTYTLAGRFWHLLQRWRSVIVPGSNLEEARALSNDIQTAMNGPQHLLQGQQMALVGTCWITLSCVCSTRHSGNGVEACVRLVLDFPTLSSTDRAHILLRSRAFSLLASKGHLEALRYLVIWHSPSLSKTDVVASLAAACRQGHTLVIVFLASLWPGAEVSMHSHLPLKMLCDDVGIHEAVKAAATRIDALMALRTGLGLDKMIVATDSEDLLQAFANRRRPDGDLLSRLRRDGIINMAEVSMASTKAAMLRILRASEADVCTRLVSVHGAFHHCRGAALGFALERKPASLELIQEILKPSHMSRLAQACLPENCGDLIDPTVFLLSCATTSHAFCDVLVREVIPCVLRHYDSAATVLRTQCHALVARASPARLEMLWTPLVGHYLGGECPTATRGDGKRVPPAALPLQRPTKRQRAHE